MIWGVGTRLTTAQPDAALDGVYKLGAIRGKDGRWSYRMKLSDTPGKSSRPGVHQVRRFYEQGQPVADLLYDEAAYNTFWQARRGDRRHDFSGADEYADMLKPVFQNGRRVYEQPELNAIRDHAAKQFAAFADRPDYPVLTDRYLDEATRDLRAWLTNREEPHRGQHFNPEARR